MKTVLVVEDDKQYRDLLRKKLEETGYGVKEAVNGEDALDVLRKDTAGIHLVLLDLAMPVMDGLTFYYHMKKSLGPDKHVIILTNLNVSAYPTEVKDYIVKTDISLDDLMVKVKEYLG